MGFPVHASAKNYSNTGTGASARFIPEVWSAKLVEKFYDATVFGEIANTDYEGEIRSHGDKVHIRTLPSITIRNYVKGAGLTYEQPESPSVELVIDQGKYFAFKLFDVDRVQSDLALMENWSADGGEQMKIAIDTDVLGSVYTNAATANAGATAGRKSAAMNLGTAAAPLAVTKSNVLDVLVDYGTVLDEQNVPESNRWVVIPARMAGLIKKSELKDASLAGDGTSMLRNGRLGMIDRFTLYSSNNLHVDTGEWDIIFGHKSAITFAAQITEMEELKDPNDFGTLARSLMVYGYEVIKPEALGHSVVTLA